MVQALCTRLLPAACRLEFTDLRGPWEVHSRGDSEVVIWVTPEAGALARETCRVPCAQRAWLSSWPGRNWRLPWVISLGKQDRAARVLGPDLKENQPTLRGASPEAGPGEPSLPGVENKGPHGPGFLRKLELEPPWQPAPL